MKMRDPLRKYRSSERRFKRIHLFIIFGVTVTVLPMVLILNTITTKAVDFTWTQTDWSGGVDTNLITANSNTFISQSSIKFDTAGEVSLGVTDNWWDPSWLYRKAVNLNNAGSTQTNYQVMVTINTQQMITDTKLQADCDDLRFMTAAGVSLNFAIDPDSTCNTSATDYWVKVDSIAAGASSIFMYYGNVGASSALNPDGTFEFFDEFTGASLDSNKWQTGVTATPVCHLQARL